MTIYELRRQDKLGSYYGECICRGSLDQCSQMLKHCMKRKHDKIEVLSTGVDSAKVLITLGSNRVVYWVEQVR